MGRDTPAHQAKETHTYIVAYPAHPPRRSDPHYVDFEAYRKRTKATAKCVHGQRINDFSDCDGNLELHHAHIEFALQNGVALAHLEAAYPGISDATNVGAWIESADNLEWRCRRHHRDAGHGVHSLTASDYEGSRFVTDVFKGTSE
jgi:hypothetical protein